MHIIIYTILNLFQDDTSSTRPRFYSLAQPETSAQDAPKLDGLACNFILGTPDKLNYYFLLESLISLLGVLNQVDADSPPLGPSGLCAAQYCFAVCWRLLLALPPSGVCMEQLASGEALERSPGRALHALVWSPRAGSRPLADWIKVRAIKIINLEHYGCFHQKIHFKLAKWRNI